MNSGFAFWIIGSYFFPRTTSRQNVINNNNISDTSRPTTTTINDLNVLQHFPIRWSNNPALCCLAEKERPIDECVPHIGISSCHELIGDQFLEVVIWIVGVLCLLSNAMVIWWRIKEHKVQIITSNSSNRDIFLFFFFSP